MNLELRAGKRRAEALHNLAERTGVEDLKKLVAVLVQTDRFGTSIAQSLRGHADYLRTMARQRAEEGPVEAGGQTGVSDFLLRAAVAVHGDNRTGDHSAGSRSDPYDRKHVFWSIRPGRKDDVLTMDSTAFVLVRGAGDSLRRRDCDAQKEPHKAE